MKYSIFSLLMLSLLTVGCEKDTGKAGGPGATSADEKPPLVGLKDNTFTFSSDSVTVKQSETTPTTVEIKRGTNFAQDVSVSFTDLPKGVTANPASPKIKSSETEAKFNLVATEDAKPGEYTVKMTGHPATGSDATNQFTLTVGKKDTFTLSTPFWTTSMKQGETKVVIITISRDMKFDQDVTLNIDGLPKGLTADPAAPVIKNGEKEVSFTLKADADATLGDFAAMLTGHPTKGADVSHPFKFTIAQK